MEGKRNASAIKPPPSMARGCQRQNLVPGRGFDAGASLMTTFGMAPPVRNTRSKRDSAGPRRISIRGPGGISGGSSGPPLGLQYLQGTPGAPHSQPPSSCATVDLS